MWSYFDAECAGWRTRRTRKHSRSHLLDVYPGVMFNLISCLHTRLWWDWQSLILDADSQVLYCLQSTWHLSLRQGWIAILQYNSRHFWRQECTQIPNPKHEGIKKTKNTSIFGNTKMKWKKQIKTVHYFHSLDTWRTKDKHSEVIFTIYNYTHIEYLFLKVMNCISCIMSNINAPLAVTALCTALPWTIFYCLDVSPFSVNCHLTLTIKCKKQSQQSPRNRRDRQYSQVWSNH